MQELHGTAYYANTYNKLQALAEQGSIILTKAGQSTLVTLNLGNYLLIDMLTEMELERKKMFLKGHPELQMLFMEIETYYEQMSSNISISIARPERNRKLNRIELLILQSIKETQNSEQALAINELMQEIQHLHSFGQMHNIKLDYLILSRSELTNRLSSKEKNPLQEMLADEITILNPQGLWHELRNAYVHGLQIKTSEQETNPAKISELDLVYNLTRFGYKEFGSELGSGKDICIEYMITAILMKNDARRITAIPIILAKNRVNYNLLIFLSQKYSVADRLLGLLKVLNDVKRAKEIETPIHILEAMNVKAIGVDQEAIKNKMRLYNA